jgi:outer membrane cobalamin receptor
MYKLGDATTARLFYKQSYRVPTFGELYYYQLIPWDLRPELANQVNIGVTQLFAADSTAFSGQLTLDAYYNRVKDKIVAKPTGSMYYWSMENFGLVDIYGVDATADVQIAQLSVRVNYSFQAALNHTDPNSRTYGHQIVYTPRHSGGANLRWESPWVNLGATAMVVGDRYYRMENSPATLMPAYCDLGLSADREFDLHPGSIRLQVQVLNLLDVQYEVVRSYPMMGRNYRLKITYIF